MRIAQVALAASGMLLLLLGSTVLGAVAVAVGVGAFVVSGTRWYREIYFQPPAVRARVCTNGRRPESTAGMAERHGSPQPVGILRRHP
jgi:hypothetical protein